MSTQRKGPISHEVRSHMRDGVRVHKYHRGHGHALKREKVNRISLMKHDIAKPTENWKVTVRYAEGSDTFSTNAENVKGAMDVGIERSKDTIRELQMEKNG